MGQPVEPTTGKRLARRLNTLREQRRGKQRFSREQIRSRSSLTPRQRAAILEKTDRRCHICGGKVEDDWQADHVLAYSGGGHSKDANYLAAHRLCNNYRWDYLSEEFQYILKIGVWAVNEIRREAALGQELAERFVAKESGRRFRLRT